jgi:ureidoacrylate peracid hydrolase
MARRGKFHWFDEIDKNKTALLIIDMQDTFCEPGSPAEVPASRDIIDPINKFTKSLRELNVPIIWVVHANSQSNGSSDWELFFNYVVSSDVKEKTIASLAPAKQKIYRELLTEDSDFTIIKNRYSALIPGSSSLEVLLKKLGVDTVLITGTKTNVCCESTARDAMMLDFKVIMVEDCCAALSEEEHRSALETIIQQFGDVMTAPEVLAKFK